MALGAAVIGSAVIGGIFANKAAGEQADAAENAAETQAEASGQASDAQVEAARVAAASQEKMSREAIDFQRWAFNETAARQEPWLQAGRQSLAQLSAGIESGEFTAGAEAVQRGDPTMDPGYDFRFDEGQRAQERSAAARGNLLSGGQAKALQRWSQGLASQEYQNAWNRNEQQYLNDFNREMNLGQTQYNQLAGVAGTGQVVANQLGQSQGALGSDVGNLLTGIGNAQATGAYNTGNALATGYTNAGNALAQGQIGAGNAYATGYQNIAGAAQGGIQNYLFGSAAGLF